MRAFENELITHEKCENIVCSEVCMERYFLGNNSGYGFFNLYEKELKLKDKLPTMTEDEQFALLASDGMLVKRPILVDDERVLVGFKEKEWEEKVR